MVAYQMVRRYGCNVLEKCAHPEHRQLGAEKFWLSCEAL